jgi:hypothetical protein
MQFDFRYRSAAGDRAFIDAAASAEVSLAFHDETGAIDFDIGRIALNGIEIDEWSGLYHDIHDYVCSACSAEILAALDPIAKRAVNVHRAIGRSRPSV